MGSKLSIYFDQNLWIQIAEADLGIGKPEFVSLLAMLRKQRQKIFCPVSAVHLFELHKIFEAKIRSSRISLMDEFCDGLCILPPFEIYETEVFNAAADFLGLPEKRIDIRADAFRPLIHVVGEFDVDYSSMQAQLSETEISAFRKDCEEAMRKVRFEDLVNGTFSDIESERSKKQDEAWANRLNGEKDQLKQGPKRSKTDLWNSQFTAFHVAWHGQTSQAIMAARRRGLPLNDVAGFVGSSKFREIAFPFNWISWTTAELLNAERPFDANDFYDVQHLCAALPYNDWFVTERHMRHVVASDLKLDVRYGLKCFRSAAEVQKQLGAL